MGKATHKVITPRGALVLGRIIVVTLWMAVSGCSDGPSKPDHIPPLMPCTVHVSYNGAPVEGASVLLAPETGRFAAAGLTDETGKAVMRTDGMYEGVVAGSYKVSITKKEKLDLDLGPTPSDPAEYAAYQAKLRAQPKPKHLLPEKYSSFANSGLEIQVTEGSPTEETVELTD